MVSIKNNLISLVVLILLSVSLTVHSDNNGNYSSREDVSNFIDEMSVKHNFDRDNLTALLSGSKFQERVVRIMDRQPEGTMTWTRYKKIMVTDARIKSGKEFIEKHKGALLRAEDLYGVPAPIIASIIGIETRYGRIQGNIRVIDSLMTLSFDYPRRASFFKTQLEEFLLLCREEGLNIETIKGSIAGAMGYGQFMPDSYRDYAVDFDGDNVRDLLSNPVDAIGSVANFLSKKGKWKPNTPVATITGFNEGRLGSDVNHTVNFGDNLTSLAKKYQTTISSLVEKNNLKDDDLIMQGQTLLIPGNGNIKSAFKPYMTLSDAEILGLSPKESVKGNLKVVPVELQLDDGYEYWLGFDNYYSISRYNRSKLYIMAVFEFSKPLSKFFLEKNYE
jgi:membrane-bound lytic murein transglycosylase B